MTYRFDIEMLGLTDGYPSYEEALWDAAEIIRVLRKRGYDVAFTDEDCPSSGDCPVPEKELEEVVEMVVNAPMGGTYPDGWDRRPDHAAER